MSCSYAWTAAEVTAGTTSAKTFTTEKTGITAAATAASATTGTGVGILEWSPGLYLASKKQTDYLKSAASIVSTHGESSSASRAAEYGEATGLVEGL